MTASLDMLNDYQALNKLCFFFFIFNLTSFAFFFFLASTTCFRFIRNQFVHYQHHCPMSSCCCRQDPEANPQKGRDREVKTYKRNSEIFNSLFTEFGFQYLNWFFSHKKVSKVSLFSAELCNVEKFVRNSL